MLGLRTHYSSISWGGQWSREELEWGGSDGSTITLLDWVAALLKDNRDAGSIGDLPVLGPKLLT